MIRKKFSPANDRKQRITAMEVHISYNDISLIPLRVGSEGRFTTGVGARMVERTCSRGPSPRMFQMLEKDGLIVPMVGRNSVRSSKDWTRAGGALQDVIAQGLSVSKNPR
jgi:hypothetical protein